MNKAEYICKNNNSVKKLIALLYNNRTYNYSRNREGTSSTVLKKHHENTVGTCVESV